MEAGEMYQLIVDRFESILTSASSNIDHSTEAKQRKDREPKKPETFDMDQYALAYGERKVREVTVGTCQPHDCHFCVTFQKLGRGSRYFENHILYGPTKKHYVNNCPLYLLLSIEDKNSFVYTNKFCPYCLRLKTQCKNHACGDDHLIPYPNGKKKGYVCLEQHCKHRIELCLIHKTLNRETIESRYRNLTQRFNIDFTVGVFAAESPLVAMPYISEDQCKVASDPTQALIGVLPDVDSPLADCTVPVQHSDSAMPQSAEPLGKSDSVSLEYQAFRKSQTGPDDGDLDRTILVVPQDSNKVNGNKLNHKQVNNLDQPLLVESTNQLLKDGTQLLAGNCRSIFIYSNLQGLTRPLRTIFDSAGGSSLALSNVPGRQLPACKDRSPPKCLQGIGSGKTIGEQYTMMLPMLNGGKVAIEVYSVPEILQPMNKIDLEPALHFFKENSKNDPNLNDNIKEEIAKASIYRFVEGSIDLLLGVKLLSIFPKLVHTLSCGLSIFKMQLKPSSSAHYCLGGPYNSLSSLQGIFPDGAIMLQEIDSCLSGWRESASDITHNHQILQGSRNYVYDMSITQNFQQVINMESNDDIILSIGEESKDSCDCKRPLMIGNEIVICCNNRSAVLNKLKARYLGSTRRVSDHALNKPYDRIDWLEDINAALIDYQAHMSNCEVKHSNEVLALHRKGALPNNMRKQIGQLFARYSSEFELPRSLEFLKTAMFHLDTCAQDTSEAETSHPNTFIALKCGKSFSKELKMFQEFFLKYYPKFKDTVIDADSSHITLLAFKLISEDQLQLAGIAFGAAWNKWLDLHHFHTIGSMSMGFKGTGMFDKNILFLKPSYYEEELMSLNAMLYEEFQYHGFDCDERFTPHLTFAKMKYNSQTEFPSAITEMFANVEIGNTRFYSIEMLSMKKTKNGEYPCLKALPFSQDMTLPLPRPSDDRMAQIHNTTNTITRDVATNTVNHLHNNCSSFTFHEKKETQNVENYDLTTNKEELNENLLNTMFEFNPLSKLKRFLVSKTDIEKTYYSLAEVLTYLKDVIRGEDMFDHANPSIILCSPELEDTLDMKALHVTEIRNLVLSQMKKAPYDTPSELTPDQSFTEKFSQQASHYSRAAISTSTNPSNKTPRVSKALSPPKIIKTAKISAPIITNEDDKFTLQPKFLEIVHAIPGSDKEKTVFTYGEITLLLSQYILLQKDTIFDPRNIKLALVAEDPLGEAFGVKAFHRCQVNELIRSQLIPANNDVAVMTNKGPPEVDVPSTKEPVTFVSAKSAGKLNSVSNPKTGSVISLGTSHPVLQGLLKASIPPVNLEKELETFKEHDLNWDGLYTSILTFQDEEEIKDAEITDSTIKKEIDLDSTVRRKGFYEAWNNALDAFKHQGMFTSNMRYKGNRRVKRKLHKHSNSAHPYAVPAYEPQVDGAPETDFKDHDFQLFAFPGEAEHAIDSTCMRTRAPKDYNELLFHLDLMLQTNDPLPRCSNCIDCKDCKVLSTTCSSNISSNQHKEEFIMKSLIKFDKSKGKFCVELPFLRDPSTTLAANADRARKIYDRITMSLSSRPDDKLVIIKSFKKQLDLGFAQKLSDLDEDLQKSIMNKQLYVIPWNFVMKETSVSTPVRIVLNASSKTKTGKSLNDCLCKGVPKINILPLVLVLLSDPILLTLDLQKFYNSCLIPESQYHLQCIWWEEDLDITKEPELYVLKTHTYGVVSSGRILELCLEKVAEMHTDNKDFHDLFANKLYVDDAFANCKSPEHAEKLKSDCERILPTMGFTAKGYAESYKVPPEAISDNINGENTVGVIGMVWIPEKDVLKFRPPSLDFTGRKLRGKLVCPKLFTGNTFLELNNFVPQHLTLRTVASKAGSFWDPPGIAEAWYLGVKHILRISSESVNRAWDEPIPSYLRNLWVEKFWEMFLLSRVEFPRCSFPLGVTYTELTVVGLSDMGLIGKLQCFYSLKKITEGNYHVQLIYSKSQLSDKRTVPCQELDSLNASSTVLDKICTCLGNVNRRALLMDSTICAYWLMKEPIALNGFQRSRTQNILRNCDKDNIFHIRSSWNSSDVGTKRAEPISCIIPGSFFSEGPEILKKGLDVCESESLIKRIANVVLNPAIQGVANDGFANKDMPEGYLKSSINDTPNIFIHDTTTEHKSPWEQFEGNLPPNPSVHPGIPDSSFSYNPCEELFFQEPDQNISIMAHSQVPVNGKTHPLCQFCDTQEHTSSYCPITPIHRPIYNPGKETIVNGLDQAVLVNNHTLVEKVTDRFSFHEYLVNPIEKPWSVSVRTMSVILHFLRKILLRRLAAADSLYSRSWKRVYDNLFETEYEPILKECFTNLCFLVVNDDVQNTEMEDNILLTSSSTKATHSHPKFVLKNHIQPLRFTSIFPDIASLRLAKESAIVYYLKLASSELKQFYSRVMLRKHAFLMNGIYYSKQRLLEIDNITDLMGDGVSTHELGIQNKLPCSDRHSPVALSIMMHFHRKVSNHQGVDRTWLSALSSIFIFQGQTMLSDIIKGCFHCRYKLKKKFLTSYGPINKISLSFAAVNRHVMLDLSGPYILKTRLHARPTRNNPNTTKVYLLHTVCLTSFINSIVIVEDYGSQAFTDALHRIGSRYGYPSIAYTDASRSQLQSLMGTEFTMSSFLGTVYQETGVEVKISGSGPQSHSRQGRIEKAVHLLQMWLANKRTDVESLTILQFDSLISQASAFLNSMPLCHKKRVGATSSSSLVSPFSFLIGRRGMTRAPAGYPKLANSRGDILDSVDKASRGMLNFFTASIPDLLLRPDSHDESEKMIMQGDVVLFPYEESPIRTTYKLGLVTELELDSDQKPRIVELAYANSQEQSLPLDHSDKVKLKTCCRFTRKGVHTLIKIYSASDPNINDDIDRINASFRHKPSQHLDSVNLDDDDDIPTMDKDPLVPNVPFSLVMSQMGYLIRKD